MKTPIAEQPFNGTPLGEFDETEEAFRVLRIVENALDGLAATACDSVVEEQDCADLSRALWQARKYLEALQVDGRVRAGATD